MRINKFLAQAGIASRRKVDKLIEEGKVLVNGKKAQLGQEVEPQKEKILVEGKPVSSQEKLEYFILNKPKGITTTTEDIHTRKTVLDILKSKTRLYPVGRLDVESEGLVIMTNDGELTNRLIHPKFHAPKVYEVLFLGKVGSDKIRNMQRGVELDDGLTKPAKVKFIRGTEHSSLLEIILIEGRKRQIRRMAASLHLHVLNLKRVAIGPIVLANLSPGKFRPLSKEEVFKLKKSVNLIN